MKKKYAENEWTHLDFLLFKPIMAIEIDGTSFHKKGTRQADILDPMKDNIMKKYSIPLKRIRTDQVFNRVKLKEELEEALQMHNTKHKKLHKY